MAESVAGTDWQSWQESWDRQQEWYMPDREERFRVMLDGGPPMPLRPWGRSRRWWDLLPGCWISHAVREVSRIGC